MTLLRRRPKDELPPMSNFAVSKGARLRRGLFGYRRSDVIATLERMHWQLDTIAASLDRTWQERDALRAELDGERARAPQIEAEAHAAAARIESAAREEAARIVAEAETHARRVRRDVARRLVAAAVRLEELAADEKLLRDRDGPPVATYPASRVIRGGNIQVRR